MTPSLRALLGSLSLVVGTLAVAILAPAGSLGTFLAIFALFLLLPLTIILYIDHVRSLHEADRTPRIGAKASFALRAPIVLFGAVVLAAGLAIAAWFLYNTFVERLPSYREPPWFVSFGVAPSFIAFGWHLVRRPSSHYESAA